MEHEQLLGEVVATRQVGEPCGDPVHLVGRDLADVAHMTFPWRQAPLRIEGQTDMRLGQQFLVTHRLGEEVGVSGLEIEDDIEPRRGSRSDPRSNVVERAL